MNEEQFAEWLSELVGEGSLQPREAEDLLRQRRLFDLNRGEIEAAYQGRVVGYIEDHLIDRPTVDELLDTAGRYNGQIYFERIPVGSRPEPTAENSAQTPAGVQA
jgi:hypothetical protein